MNCIVCAIAKLENEYIYEWAYYHLSLGFTRIHIYDNNDFEGESISDVFKGTEIENDVIIHNVRGLRGVQKKVYQDCYTQEDFDWCAFIDVDEFITFSDKCKGLTISGFLENKDSFDAVHLNWLCYGDCGQLTKKTIGVLERFKTPIMPIDFKSEYFDKAENSHIKSIIKKGCNLDWLNDEVSEVGSNPHTPFGLDKVCDERGMLVENSPWNTMSFQIAYIRHFITMTIEEYARKDKRKAADSAFETNRYKPSKFFLYNPVSFKRLLVMYKIYGYLPLKEIIQVRVLWWSVTRGLPISYLFSSYRRFIKRKRVAASIKQAI